MRVPFFLGHPVERIRHAYKMILTVRAVRARASCLRLELLPWTKFVWEKCTRETNSWFAQSRFKNATWVERGIGSRVVLLSFIDPERGVFGEIFPQVMIYYSENLF